MKKFLLISSAIVLFSAVGAVSAQASTVTRSFDNITPTAGSVLTVSLAVDVSPPDTFYIIDEVLPLGWVVLNPGTGDTTQPGRLRWAVINGAASIVNTYTVAVPTTALGVNAFSGEFAFDSNPVPVPTLGQLTVDVQPVPVTPVLTTVNVTPATANIAPSGAQQLTAAVLDQNSVPFLGASVSWSSNNTAVATVDPATGLVAGITSGTAVVTATAVSGAVTVTGTSNITVAVPGAVSVVTRSFSNLAPNACSPLAVSLAVDVVPPDTFYIIDEIVPAGWVISDPGTGDTTQPGHIKWAVISGAVSVVNSYTIAVPCNALGASAFSGEFAFDSNPVPVPILGQLTVDVQPTLTTINVTPAAVNNVSSAGGIQQFAAATLDQSGQPFTATVTWTSSDSLVATIDSATGLLTGVSPGTVTVTASSGVITGTAQATVQAPVLTAINVTPATTSISSAGGIQQFAAATLDQSGQPFTATVTWTSSDNAVGTISASAGLFTAVANGNAVITAASGLITGNATVTVAIPAPAPAPAGGGGGGGAGSGGGGPNDVLIPGFVPSVPPQGSAPVPIPTTPSPGQVLGAAVFNFIINLRQGASGNDVMELQKRLTADGFYSGPQTGFFGPLTLAAVKAYQQKNGLPATGFVGPLTRGKFNQSAVAGASTGNQAQIQQIQAMIQQIQAQVQVLLAQLQQLRAQEQQQSSGSGGGY